MNEKLVELFNLYRNLRSMQKLVNEILALDYYVYNYDEEESIALIDHAIKSYNREIKLICSMRDDQMVVVENDNTIYDDKDSEEINSDAEYIRDCLIIIGAVKSGIRQTFREVVYEVNGW
jgi:hypothetical protein